VNATSTLARVVTRDRAGLLSELSDVFARRGLNVVKCRAETFASGVCRDEFEVVDHATGVPPTDADALRAARLRRREGRRTKERTRRVEGGSPRRPGRP